MDGVQVCTTLLASAAKRELYLPDVAHTHLEGPLLVLPRFNLRVLSMLLPTRQISLGRMHPLRRRPYLAGAAPTVERPRESPPACVNIEFKAYRNTQLSLISPSVTPKATFHIDSVQDSQSW